MENNHVVAMHNAVLLHTIHMVVVAVVVMVQQLIDHLVHNLDNVYYKDRLDMDMAVVVAVHVDNNMDIVVDYNNDLDLLMV